ncbi:SpaH/EbpB family LPXTG-anchored major pilin [Schaalia sp. Marseille-Q2122]|uniref:SpaH/EbpB family LPXTG-anchored major pilin n=1 Tax=Schaalia sp. Marseille-Q2122 TaxID=2736604 RepID=UPI0015896E03|nr:SpaH/EbpB family LPXTG-anchored major pilin [Schaalia sp. Marseille-Q2122]
MSAHPQSLGRRIMAIGTAAALALTGIITAAGIANAQEHRPEYGNINTAQTGSITLHKRESGSQGGTVGSVFEKTDAGRPVKDVEFTYYKISGLDLTKPLDWEKLSKLKVAANSCDTAKTSKTIGGHALEDGVKFPLKTDAAGDTKVDSLRIGAYLICETDRPSTVVKPAAPFVVSVPTFDNIKGWVYNVHAYPKNTVLHPAVKDVLPVEKYGIQTDDQVTFTITAKVPQLSKGDDGPSAKDEYFKYFVIGDSLGSGYSDGKITNVQLANDAQGGSPSVIETSKYDKADSTTPTNNTKHWLSVTFNKEGLAFLRDNPNKYVIVTMTAKVDNLAGTGVLPNTGYVIMDTVITGKPTPPDQPETPPYTPPTDPGNPPTNTPDREIPIPPSNKVVTTWGEAKLKKHSQDGQETGLEGAIFEVYHAQTQDDSCSSNAISTTKSEKITVNGESQFTSNNQGIVTVAGLYVSSGKATGNEDPVPTESHRCYILKEIQAPLGYVLPKDTASQVAVKVEPGLMDQVTVNFPNTPVSVPELPITGASGTVIATVVGTSLLLLAVGAVLVRRRREAIEA